MDIASLCQRTIVSIDAAASLQEAAALMRLEHVGSLVVTSLEGGQPHAVGLVTDRDLVVQVLACGTNLRQTSVGDVAGRQLVTVSAGTGLGEAVDKLAGAGVRRLLVTGADRQIIGLVSADDLLAALAQQISTMALALRSGVHRERRDRPAVEPTRPPVFLAFGTSATA